MFGMFRATLAGFGPELIPDGSGTMRPRPGSLPPPRNAGADTNNTFT